MEERRDMTIQALSLPTHHLHLHLATPQAPQGTARRPKTEPAQPRLLLLRRRQAARGAIRETRPVSTGGGTRRVQLVREEGRDASS
jgi:hypothetical protein